MGHIIALVTMIGGSLLMLVGAIAGWSWMTWSGYASFGTGILINGAMGVMLFNDNKAWIMRLRSLFQPGTMPVEIVDYKCERRYTIARPMGDGRFWAYTYDVSKVGKVIMLSNGVIDPDCDSSFMYLWMPLDRHDRTMFVLANNFPDLEHLQQCSEQDRWDAMNAWRQREVHNATR